MSTQSPRQPVTSLRAILDSVADAVLVLAEDGAVLVTNRHFRTLWRIGGKATVSRQQQLALAEVISLLVDPEPLTSALSRPGDPDEERSDTLRLKDGRTLQLFTRGLSLDGELLRVCSFRDITEETRPAAADNGRELQARLQKIAAAAPGVIYSFRLRPDGSTCLPYASPAIQRLFGVRPEAIADDASALWRLVHPDDIGRLNQSIAESARTLSQWKCEFRARTSEGDDLWIHGQSVPSREPDGSVLWHGFLSDVTEQKRTELRLEEEAIRRRALFERSTDGIVVMDAGGAVCELNQSFADMLGYSLEEAGRLHVWDWDVQWNRDQLIEKIANDPKVTFETRHRRKDGSIYDVEISSNAVEWRGQLLRFCVCRDITERKRAQAQIKTLSGLLPICAWCKKIRDDSGYWRQLEIYVSEHSEADFSHGICPECAEEVYPVRARDGDR